MNRSGPRILLILFTSALISASSRAATPAEVDRAIEKAKAFLYSQQRGGTWDPAKPPAKGKGHGQWGGPTALATYALLAAGESRQSVALKPAIEFLKTADIEETRPSNVSSMPGGLLDTLTLDDVPENIKNPVAANGQLWFPMPADPINLDDFEREIIRVSLQRHDGNQSQTSKYLGITRSALIYRMQKYGLE